MTIAHKELLNAGADVHAQDDAALHSASANGHTEIVKMRLTVNRNRHEKYDEDQARFWAVCYGIANTVISSGKSVILEFLYRRRSASGSMELLPHGRHGRYLAVGSSGLKGRNPS